VVVRLAKSISSRWVGLVARMGQIRNAYRILARKLLVKLLFGRPRRRWGDN
jgi:hypothetical protein